MKKYKLKEEAKKYFADNLKEKIESIEFWEHKGVDLQTLEELPIVRIEYGIDHASYRDMCGWTNGQGCRFHFTTILSNMSILDYNKVKSHIPSLMKDLEAVTKNFIEKLDEKDK